MITVNHKDLICNKKKERENYCHGDRKEKLQGDFERRFLSACGRRGRVVRGG